MLNFSPKNRFLVILIIFLILINFPLHQVRAEISFGDRAKCAAIGAISPSQAIKCVFEQLGITEETVQENAKYLDAANYKYPYPQVTLTFSPTDPKPGEKVTASALPTNFGNPPDANYFTWYLQKEACTLNPHLKKNYSDPDEEPEDWSDFNYTRYRPGQAYNEPDGRNLDDLCNLNKDYYKDGNIYTGTYKGGGGIVDIEDYKIKAARIYAGNGFESDSITYNADTDSDGYEAILGGDDQKGKKEEQCFFRDVKAGKDYAFTDCFHLFPEGYNIRTGEKYTTGDDSFGKGEEEAWQTNPNDPDTAQTGHMDEANVAGLGAKDFSWTYQEGDKIGVAVEGVSTGATMLKDATYKIMWAIPGGTCEGLDEPDIFLDEDKLGENPEDIYAHVDPTIWPATNDAATFTRTLIIQKYDSENSEPSELSSYQVSNIIQTKKTEVISLPSISSGGSTTTGTIDPVTGAVNTATNNNELDERTTPTTEQCNAYDEDALDDDTATVLGTNESCCPEELEGDGCSIISSTTETTTIGADINTETIFTLDSNKFNKLCLSKNLVTPTGAGENEKIDVSLSFSPANPVNDTSTEGDNADWINVVSTVENPTNNEALNYTWTVFAGQYADPDATWTALSKNHLGKDANENPVVEQTTGTGIPNLKFKANFTAETPDGNSTKVPKYLKVKLNVSEKVAYETSGGTRKGNAEVIIPLSSFNNKLSLFNTQVSASLVLTQGTQELCKIKAAKDSATALVDAAVCQVAPDEIVAVEAALVPPTGESWDDYNFLWTLNGESLSYKYHPNYNQSDFKPGKSIFFPVLASKGSTLNLSLIATNQKTSTKLSLAKTFLVSEPTFKITSTDTDTSKPKLLGNYIDLDEKKWPDYSQTEFLAKTDSAIKLALAQFAAFPFPDIADLPITWYWDNMQLETTDRSLSLNTTGDTGSSFSLKAEGIYTQDRNTKKALNEYWGVTLGEFYEQQLSQTVDFTLADSVNDPLSAQNGRGKILASFISSVPAYFAFLFRLVMTAFVLLATIWILFALSPQAQKND